MKSLKKILGALLICAVAFSACNKDEPEPPPPPPPPAGDMPEVAPVAGKIVIVLNTANEADVCNGLVFAGNYNDWNTDPAQMAHFVAIEGFEGWYKAEITPAEPGGGVSGKPNQLDGDGNFPSSWDYQWFAQMDGETVVNQCEIIEGDAVLYDEYAGEKGLEIAAGADVVYIRAHAWKKNPCIPAVTYTITFNVTVPDELESSDVVYIVGGLNGWTVDASPMTKSGNIWTITLDEIEFGTEYKYVLNASWDYEELKAVAEGEFCADPVANRKVNDRTMDDVVENFRGITAERCGNIIIKIRDVGSAWENIYIYSWGETPNFEPFGSWPGELLELEDGWYTFEVPIGRTTNLILHNGSGTQFNFISSPTKNACFEINSDESSFEAVDCDSQPMEFEYTKSLAPTTLTLNDNFQYGDGYQAGIDGTRLFEETTVTLGAEYLIDIEFTLSRDLEEKLQICLVDPSPPSYWTEKSAWITIGGDSEPVYEKDVKISYKVKVTITQATTDALVRLFFDTGGEGNKGTAGSGVEGPVTLNFTKFNWSKIKK